MKKLALIVDDEKDIAQFIAECLTRMGYQCICAFRFEDVLEIISDKKMAIAVVDIFMPGMGGLEGIKKIREVNEDCRILAVSGGYQSMISNVALHAAMKTGADAILPKPFRVHEIREAVLSLADQPKHETQSNDCSAV